MAHFEMADMPQIEALCRQGSERIRIWVAGNHLGHYDRRIRRSPSPLVLHIEVVDLHILDRIPGNAGQEIGQLMARIRGHDIRYKDAPHDTDRRPGWPI